MLLFPKYNFWFVPALFSIDTMLNIHQITPVQPSACQKRLVCSAVSILERTEIFPREGLFYN